jgi:transcriptional regulator with XRE-family HTH domain
LLATTVFVAKEHPVPQAPPASLATTVRKAREDAGLGVRELARRSGISAGQISRIENGEVSKPEMQTLVALARGLGRPHEPLLVLSGQLTDRDAVQALDPLLVEGYDLVDVVEAAADWLKDEDPAGIRYAADRIFLRGPAAATAPWLGGADPTAGALAEIAAAWAGLTPERRNLVLAFVADQEILSRMDRMPRPAGRYELTIQLRDREDRDGE